MAGTHDLSKAVRQILTEQEQTRSNLSLLFDSVLKYYDDRSKERPSLSAIRKARQRVIQVSPHLAENMQFGQLRRRRAENWKKMKGQNGANSASASVRCIDTGTVYDSVRQAAEQTGIQINAIYKCLSNEIKTAGGCHWEYVMEPETLCFTCAKACGRGNCPWANRFLPVPGWDADSYMRDYNGRKTRTYHIKSCPLYIPDQDAAEEMGTNDDDKEIEGEQET